MEKTISQILASYEQGRLSRRGLIAGLVALLGSTRSVQASTFKGMSLNHVALSVTDIQRSKAFYQKHFGLPVVRESENSCFLDLGPHFLALFRSSAAGMNHYCIAIDPYDADAVVETLKSEGLKSRRSGNRVYFHDPDGIEVQVSARDHTA